MPAEEIILKYEVPPSYEGLRVDVFLKNRLKRTSRTKVKQIIESRNCYFESGREMTPSARVEAREIICIRREVKDEIEVPAHYGVIHEDRRILVVDKPAGLPVHPTSRYLKNTLVGLIRRDYGETSWNLCHRIDRETSGIVLLAKDLKGERFIKKQFADRQVHKSYLALVKGTPDPREGIIKAALRRNLFSRILMKMEIAGEDDFEPGKVAVTRYITIDSSKRFALVECFPETGRQHQIRIHMAHIGNALVGDKIYGVSESLFLDFVKYGLTHRITSRLLLPRHALHAHSISFLHPDGGKPVQYTSPLAPDIRELFEADGA
ncbi:MAG: RluA family pseudouridine synthase [Pseudomonadota bacterium]